MATIPLHQTLTLLHKYNFYKLYPFFSQRFHQIQLQKHLFNHTNTTTILNTNTATINSNLTLSRLEAIISKTFIYNKNQFEIRPFFLFYLNQNKYGCNVKQYYHNTFIKTKINKY